MRTRIALIAIITLLSGLLLGISSVAGDRLRNATEKAKDRQDIRQDSRQLADNAASVDRLHSLIDQWNTARRIDPGGAETTRLNFQILNVFKHDLRLSAVLLESRGTLSRSAPSWEIGRNWPALI